jgi:hypothetical protein
MYIHACDAKICHNYFNARLCIFLAALSMNANKKEIKSAENVVSEYLTSQKSGKSGDLLPYLASDALSAAKENPSDFSIPHPEKSFKITFSEQNEKVIRFKVEDFRFVQDNIPGTYISFIDVEKVGNAYKIARIDFLN